MRIAIRADASSSIGTGHMMRCMTLAAELKDRGSDVVFVCRVLKGHLCEYAEAKGFPVIRLQAERAGELDMVADAEATVSALHVRYPDGADWIIVDHYKLDHRWERVVRPQAKRIMVIDDLADRLHDCDLLLDQNVYLDMESRYDHLVPQNCARLLGPRFALLRPEFYEARRRLRLRSGKVERILVFFGGSDPTNETAKTLLALRQMKESGKLEQVAVDVVVGASNPNRSEIERMTNRLADATFHCQVPYIAQLMASAGLAIGAGGTATWERLMLGLPSLTVIVADNQEEITECVADNGLARNLGWHDEMTVDKMIDAITESIRTPEKLAHMEKKALSFMPLTLPDGIMLSTVARRILMEDDERARFG